MVKTIIVLPDGTQLSSGPSETNALQSATVTQCVNDAQELSLGSTCATMLEAKIITRGGSLHLNTGDEIALYRECEGSLHKLGIFVLEKPTRSSANSYSITAYDRIILLDKDLTSWLVGLNDWPYRLKDFANMVCNVCGLKLANETIPNENYLIQKFSADGVTGRQLMRWIGQVAGRFCRATPDGDIEFAWYEPIAVPTIGPTQILPVTVEYRNGALTLTSDKIISAESPDSVSVESSLLKVSDDGLGNVTVDIDNEPIRLWYYQGSLSLEDYTVAPIERVQLRQSEEDVGTVWPNTPGALNTYIISGNCLLTASTSQELVPIAQTLYEQLKDFSYTPCKVSMSARIDISSGNILTLTDANNHNFRIIVMTKTSTGSRDTLECTGSHSRDSSTAVNSQTFKALSGKVLNLRTDVEGLKIENKDTAGKMANLELTVSGIATQVSEQKSSTDGLKDQITTLEQTASEVKVSVQSIQDNGVSKVSNEFGMTIDGSAVTIHRSGSEMTNSLNEEGMYVIRDKGTSKATVMLQADAKGVTATDVTVRNYLVVGNHARFEDYNNGTDSKRTACFWVVGG